MLLGGLIGALTAGIFADFLGRKKVRWFDLRSREIRSEHEDPLKTSLITESSNIIIFPLNFVSMLNWSINYNKGNPDRLSNQYCCCNCSCSFTIVCIYASSTRHIRVWYVINTPFNSIRRNTHSLFRCCKFSRLNSIVCRWNRRPAKKRIDGRCISGTNIMNTHYIFN